MRRLIVMGASLALVTLVVSTAVVHGQQTLPYTNVKDMAAWEAGHSGGKGGKGPWQSAPKGATNGIDSLDSLNIDGSYWANGPLDRVNGLASWNGVTISNFWARTADDFVIGVPAGVQNTPFTLCLQPLISEVRTTMIGNTNSPLELEIWSTATTATGPTNVPSEAAGGDVLNNKFSTVFTTLAPAFNFNVEEYVFTFSPALALPSGRFWINPLGNGYPNYFATSQGGRDGTATGPGFFRGAIFGFPSWVSATTQVAPPGQFAFDIDAACALPFRVRILGGFAAAAAVTSNAPEGVSPNKVKTLEFTVGNAMLEDQPDMDGYEFSSGFTSLGATVVGCSSSVGTCTVNGNMVTADYSLAAASEAIINVMYEAGPSSPDLQTCVVTGTSLPRTSQCVNAHTSAFSD